MDDRNFGTEAAEVWIQTIESPAASLRDKDIYPLLKEWLAETSGGTVLDIGCGQGVCCLQVPSDVSYVGIDPSPALIQRAFALYQHPQRRFLLGNVYDVPINEESVQRAFSIAVWHLLGDIERASKELGRVLVRGGQFLIISADPGSYAAWTRPYKEFSIDGKRFEGKTENSSGAPTTDVLYLHPYEDILDALSKSDLVVLETRNFRNMVAIMGKRALT